MNRTAVATLVYFASHVLVGTLGGTVGPTLGPFATQVGVGLSAIGVILTTRSLGYLAGSLVSSRFMERVSVHRGLAAAALLVGAALAWLPWTSTLGLLMALAVPLGFATAGLDVGVSTMLLRAYRERAAPLISALHFCYGIGGLSAPFLVAALGAGRETRVNLPLAVGFALLAAAYLALPAPARSPTAPGKAPSPNPSPPGESRGFALPLLVFLLYVGAEIGFASWLYEFVNLQYAAAAATAVTGAFWAGFSASRFGGILAARRWAPRQTLLVAYGAGLASVVLLIAAPKCLPAVWIGAIGFGLAVGPIYPNVVTAISQRFEMGARRFGAIAVASCLGSMTFPWLIGRLLDVGGPLVIPIMTAGLLMASFAVWETFARAKPRRAQLVGRG